MVIIIPILSVPQLSFAFGGNRLREAQIQFKKWLPAASWATNFDSSVLPVFPEEVTNSTVIRPAWII